ncbi:MAG: glycolate oxidase subunit GlcF, partial [Halomonas sp.]|nr:glycolate oxidase subunit GlcF [Halomonas sp.]
GTPELTVTANIGCQTHLAGASRTPVRHWIEIVDDSLASATSSMPREARPA